MEILTYIITYQHSFSKSRLSELKYTLNWISSFDNVQIILIEQGKNPIVNYSDYMCEYHFIENNGTFNKSWAFNYGLKYAKADYVAFADFDVVMKPESLIKSLNYLIENKDKYDMISPHSLSKVVNLTDSEIKLKFSEKLKIERENDMVGTISGGISIYSKTSIDKVGGWTEEFSGYGGEDDFQDFKIKKFLKYKILDNYLYHLHKEPDVNPNLYERNLAINSKLQNLDDNKLYNYLYSSSRMRGNKHKN